MDSPLSLASSESDIRSELRAVERLIPKSLRVRYLFSCYSIALFFTSWPRTTTTTVPRPRPAKVHMDAHDTARQGAKR